MEMLALEATGYKLGLSRSLQKKESGGFPARARRTRSAPDVLRCLSYAWLCMIKTGHLLALAVRNTIAANQANWRRLRWR